MTPDAAFERTLADRVAAAWMVVCVLLGALRVGSLILHQKQIAMMLTLFLFWRWIILAPAAGILAISTWRSADRAHGALRIIAAATALFVACTTADMAMMAATGASSWRYSRWTAVTQQAWFDLSYFFIIAVGTIAATLMIRAYRNGLAAERDAAELEASLSDARVRNLRTNVQPAFIRQSLEGIEMLLAIDPRRAESALLTLSDFLRIALQRTRAPQWPPIMEAEYLRLEAEAREACLSS